MEVHVPDGNMAAWRNKEQIVRNISGYTVLAPLQTEMCVRSPTVYNYSYFYEEEKAILLYFDCYASREDGKCFWSVVFKSLI